MGFEERQVRQLRARLNPRKVQERDADGTTIRYLEGSHVISEANRIFGFDGWNRETVEAKCVYTKQIGDRYSAAYVTRIRITVAAGEGRIVREGSGAGEATTDSPGSAHERAAKSAETDATKRALVTFGNRFGLSLYGQKNGQDLHKRGCANGAKPSPQPPKNGTGKTTNGAQDPAKESGRTAPTGQIDKSTLALGEPKRVRSKPHLRYVASRPCVVCGRGASEAHHLTFTQPRALSRKVSDEFTVPLCRDHHNELHRSGNEKGWWHNLGMDPTIIALELWEQSTAAIG
ncbi:MAG: Rad52/Rad22 family DNA repair protein [Rhizobiaceae bacterium]